MFSFSLSLHFLFFLRSYPSPGEYVFISSVAEIRAAASFSSLLTTDTNDFIESWWGFLSFSVTASSTHDLLWKFVTKVSLQALSVQSTVIGARLRK